MKVASRRGFMGIPIAIAIVLLLFLSVVAGSFQVSSTRNAVARLHARRTLYLAANSAIEEVCSRIEALPALSKLPVPGDPRKRQLKQDVLVPAGFPLTLAPQLTRKEYQDGQVEISDVKVESSDWVLDRFRRPDRSAIVREMGMLQFELKVKVQSGNYVLDKKLTTRRYAEVSPDMGETTCRIKIQHNNLFFRLD